MSVQTQPFKRAARGRNGVVVSHNVEAALTGARVLEEGGTAVDAAIAMSFVTAVRETAMNGIGGAGVMLAFDGASGATTEVDFYGRTPAALPADVFVPHLLPASEPRMEFGWRGTRDDVSQRGYLSVGVPAYLAGLGVTHERLATMPWATLLEPATALARGGFDLDEEDVAFLVAFAGPLARHEVARDVYMPDGLTAAATTRLRLPDLARSLGALAEGGPRAFGGSELAERVAAHVQRGGGYLTAEDMRRYEPLVGDGLRGRYRDHEVVSSSGAMGGVTLIEMLNLAEELELGSLEHNSGEYLHRLTEVIRQAWIDRFTYVGDPDAQLSSLAGLVDKRYARTVAAEIPRDRAATIGRPGDPWAFVPGGVAPPAGAAPAGDGGGTHTTSLAAADRHGNVATFTQTLGQCYGSCVAAPGTGMLVYDMTYWLDPAPGSPNSVGPWKRPAGHATPVLLLKDGRPVAGLGAPGGRKIVTAMLQVILNMVDFGMDVQEAIAAPRIHLEGADPVDPRGPTVKLVDVDDRIDAAATDALTARGHEVRRQRDSAVRIRFGRPVGVQLDGDELVGGVDVYGKSLGVAV